MQIGKVMSAQGTMVQGVGQENTDGKEFVDLLQLLLGGEAAKQGQSFPAEQTLEMTEEADADFPFELPEEVVDGKFNLFMPFLMQEQRITNANLTAADAAALSRLLHYSNQETIDTRDANQLLVSETLALSQEQNNGQQGLPVEQRLDTQSKTIQPQMGISTNMFTASDTSKQTQIYLNAEQDAGQETIAKSLTVEVDKLDQESYQKADATITRTTGVSTPTNVIAELYQSKVTPEIELLQKAVDASETTQNPVPSKDLPGSQVVTEEITVSGSLIRELSSDDQAAIKQGEVAKAQELQGAKVNQLPQDKLIPVFGKQTQSGYQGNQQNSSLPGDQQLTEVSLSKGTSQKEADFFTQQELSQQIPTKTFEQSNMTTTLPREVPVSQFNAKLTEMIRALVIQQNPGQTTLKMKLQPEQLGEVTVQLTWSKGELSAQFITATGAAKEALESAFPQLKELLAQQNIRLSEAAVFMGQQTGQWEQRSFAQREHWQFASKGRSKGNYSGRQVDMGVEAVSAQPTAKSGVNLVV